MESLLLLSYCLLLLSSLPPLPPPPLASLPAARMLRASRTLRGVEDVVEAEEEGAGAVTALEPAKRNRDVINELL